jgi:hypothetical protein
MDDLSVDKFPPFGVPILAPFMSLERKEFMLAWRASFDEEVENYPVKLWINPTPQLGIIYMLKLWLFLLIKTTT